MTVNRNQGSMDARAIDPSLLQEVQQQVQIAKDEAAAPQERVLALLRIYHRVKLRFHKRNGSKQPEQSHTCSSCCCWCKPLLHKTAAPCQAIHKSCRGVLLLPAPPSTAAGHV